MSAVLLLMLLLGPIGTTQAQSMDRPAPSPISTRVLARYAERLQLGEEQLQAVQRIHERYREAFDQVERELIQPYVAERGGGMMIKLDVEAIREDVKEIRDVLRAVERIDDRFFDELQQLLTEEQMRRLPQVRQMRQREREMAGATMGVPILNRAALADVTRLAEEAAGSIAIGSDADVILGAYERRLTKKVSELHEASVTSGLRMLERLQARGVDLSAEPEEGDDMSSTFDALFQAMNETHRDAMKLAREIGSLNRETIAKLRNALPQEAQLRLEQSFLRQAYPQSLGRTGEISRRIDWALDQKSLTDEQRQAVEELQRSWIDQSRRMFEKIMDASDDARRDGLMINPEPEQIEAQEAARKKEQDVLKERDELIERTSLALDGLLGEDMTRRLADAMEQDAEEETTETRQEVMVMAVATTGEGDGEGGPAAIRSFSSTFELDAPSAEEVDRMLVPQPISRRELDDYAALMRLEASERPVAETIHEGYASDFETMRREALKSLREADSAYENEETEGRIVISQPSEEEVRTRFDRERRTMQRVLEHDAGFFADLSLILGEDEERLAGLERAKLARQRDVFSGRKPGPQGPGMFGGGGFIVINGMQGGDEAGVDVAELAGGLELTDEQRAEVQPILLPYEREAARLFRERYEARREQQEETGLMQARMAKEQEEAEGRSIAFGPEQFEAIERHQRIVDRITSELLTLNRTTLDAVAEAVGQSEGRRLVRAYWRAAYPQAYRDRASAHAVLERTLLLPDLTADQQSQVRTLAAEYRSAHEAIGDQLAQIRAKAASDAADGGGEAVGFEGMQQRRQELSAVQFERDELNDRTRLRLREILTDVQEEALGEMLDPPAER
jgi:hypothetical protein